MASKYRDRLRYDGKIYYVYAKTKQQLELKKALLLRDLEEGRRTISNNTTLSQWAEKCVDAYKTGQAEITRKKYWNRMKCCILNEIGEMRLKDIKPLHCQQVLNLQAGKSKSQINEVCNALKFLFSKAVDNQLIASNPASGLTKPAGTKTTRRAITEHERKHIMAVVKTDRRYLLYWLMLSCGCRPSEAAEVQGRDIKIIEGFPVLHIRGTKSKNADRIVPLPLDLYSAIKRTPPFEYVACYNTGRKIDEENRSRLWRSFKRQLNISMGCRTYRNQLIPPYPVASDLVPYCLRHTYCTDLARAGFDIRIAQKLMGHSDISLTANIYTNLDTSDIISVARKMYQA